MREMRGGWIAAWVLLLCMTGAAAPRALAAGKPSGVRLVVPDALNGRPRLTDSDVQESLAAMERSVKEAIPGDETVVVGMYGDRQANDVVQILAIGRSTAEADRQIDAMFQPLRDRGWTVSDLEPVEPGPLGGTAKCADVTTPTGDQSMCAWADEHSVGSVTFYPKQREEAEREFVGIRSLIEQRP